MIFSFHPAMTQQRAHIAVSYLIEGLPDAARAGEALAVTAIAAVVCLVAAWITGAETWRQYVSDTQTISAEPDLQVVGIDLHSLWIVEQQNPFSSPIHRRCRNGGGIGRGNAILIWWTDLVGGDKTFSPVAVCCGFPIFVAFLILNSGRRFPPVWNVRPRAVRQPLSNAHRNVGDVDAT